MSDAGTIFDPEFGELLPDHLAQLRASGIADELIRERGYSSILGSKRLKDAGFADYQLRRPGILMPVWTPDGGNGLYQYRPDNPRMDKAGKVFKYETPAKAGLRLDVPPRCRPELADPSVPLYITEGIKKGDAGASHGLCVVVLMGVWGFRGRNDLGGMAWLGDWQFVALNDRLVNVVFDSDVMTNPKVKNALDMLTEMIHRKGATVRHVFLPSGPRGEKVGLDDFLLSHPVEDLERYATTPTLAPQARQPAIVLKLAPGNERHLSDTGNAYRLVARHGADLRYCWAWGKWLVWTGARWQVDDRGQVVSWAKDTVRAIYAECAETNDSELRKALAEWALSSESSGRLKSMVELARNEIPITPEEMDREPWLFNVPNGTINLRTGQLRGHQREDYITKLGPIPYDPAATCPAWEMFLHRVIGGLAEYLQNAVGYSLTGDVSEQVLFFLHGVGANGKSTFLNAILGILGDYAKQAAPGLLTVKGDAHPTEIADIFGVRFLSTVEISEGRELAETLVKQMTGGDPMKGRRMREDFWSFMPTHKIWLAANHKPIVKGTDYAIWRRVRLIPFEVVIPVAERDRKLGERLQQEYPGIFAWAIAGCLRWQRDGLGLPEVIEAATEAYRTEMDALSSFLTDCCVLAPNAQVEKTTLYTEYKKWCEKSGERYETQRVLSSKMKERQFDHKRVTDGREAWIGVGLALKNEVNEVNEVDSRSPLVTHF